jgi:hypothetical protein
LQQNATILGFQVDSGAQPDRWFNDAVKSESAAGRIDTHLVSDLPPW